MVDHIVGASLGEGGGFAEVIENPRVLSELPQRIAKRIEAKINGALERRAVIRKMPQSGQRLLAGCHDLPERGPCHRLCCRLLGIQHGLVPHLAACGVVRQPFDLFGQSLGIESLDGFHDLAVEDPPALGEKAS